MNKLYSQKLACNYECLLKAHCDSKIRVIVIGAAIIFLEYGRSADFR